MAQPPAIDEWMLPEDGQSAKALFKLAAKLKVGRASALMGAGVAASLGFPTWSGLLDELGKELEGIETLQTRNMLAAQRDMLWRAEEYRQKLTDPLYEQFLRGRFGDKSKPVSPLVQNLIKLNFKHIFTTNYDISLQRAHVLAFGEPPNELDWNNRDAVRIFLSNLADAETDRHYVHLHGRYDRPEQIVLTYRDYVAKYVENDDMVQKMFVLFATHHFVFVGFSLDDPDFVQILRQVNSRLGKGASPAHYAILPAERPEEIPIERRRLQNKYDVDPIFYHKTPGDNHVNLAKLISSLAYLQESPPDVELLAKQETVQRDFSLAPESSGSSPLTGLTSVEVPADPQKNRWGKEPRRNGRELTAKVTEVSSGWYRIDLFVQSVENSPYGPLQGTVTFHLHDTFDPQDPVVVVNNGIASLSKHAYGAFTVGAEADDGKTQLELDLAEDSSFPKDFRER
jgi:NAD-dependent SIR2 family protein deacetylase